MYFRISRSNAPSVKRNLDELPDLNEFTPSCFRTDVASPSVPRPSDRTEALHASRYAAQRQPDAAATGTEVRTDGDAPPLPSPLKRMVGSPRKRLLTTMLASLIAMSGCGGGGGGGSATSAPATGGTPQSQAGWTIVTPAYVQPTKKWTVLVFLNAANDLEEFGTLNANQMEQVGSNNDVNIVVQFKRIKGMYDTSDGDWGGTRRYFITRDYDTGHVSSPILSYRNDLNMGDPQALQDFIQWGVATYPASHYCLVVWNHGAGWRSQAISGSSRAAATAVAGRGVSYDDEYANGGYSSHIDTIQLPAAIDLGNGRKWDLLAWDASLMQMAEVAYEIRDKASYIVGSEESPPGTGFPYDRILSALTGAPNQDGRTLGTTFATQMLAANGASSNITESVLDCSKLADLAPALDSLGTALTAISPNYRTTLNDVRLATENYDYPENRDLLDFVNNLSTTDSTTGQNAATDAGVGTAIGSVRSVLNNAIVFNNVGAGHPNSHGLAVFLPSPTQYASIDVSQANGFGQRYTALSLAKAAPHWQNYLATGGQ